MSSLVIEARVTTHKHKGSVAQGLLRSLLYSKSMSFLCPHQLPLHSLRCGGSKRSIRAINKGSTAALVQTPVLVQDSQLVKDPPLSPQELLAQNRAWSYTTALIRDSYHVVDWRLHLERLLRNARLLGRQNPDVYTAFLSWLDQQAMTDAAVVDLLDGLVSPQAAQALHHLALRHPNPQDTMMVVVLTDTRQECSGQLADVPAQSCPPVSVLVWAKPAPRMHDQPATVLVAGEPRPLAQAKHCDWVIARRPLEHLKQQAAADEVILSSSSGELLEGLASNWYVIADEEQLGATTTAAAVDAAEQCSTNGAANASSGSSNHKGAGSSADVSSNAAGKVLLTTGPTHAALLGVTQQRVLEAAAAIGLKVQQQLARLDQRHAWREAFVTNCLRGIQPVSTVLDAPGSTIWISPEGCGAVTAQLQQELARLQQLTDMSGYL